MSEAKNRPNATLYVVRNFEDKEGKDAASWLKVGSAWLHKDGEGFNIVIQEGISVSGRVVVRVNKTKEEKE
jgi:hypothetical protein